MGALVAALSKRGDDVVPLVTAMLQELIHRGAQSHEVITPNATILAESLEELRNRCSISSSVSIGLNVSSHDTKALPHPKHSGAVFEGRIFHNSANSSPTQITSDKSLLPEEMAKTLLRNFDGSYALAFASTGRMLIGRDPLGTMPLYYGEDDELCVVALERKALWKIGIHDASSFPPGNLAIVNPEGFSFKSVWTIPHEPPRRIKMHNAVMHLKSLLEESTRERLRGAKKVGIAFSGGLDSSLIAHLAQKAGVTVRLVSVGLEGQPELSHASEAARALGLPIILQEYSIGDVEKTLPKVLWLVEEPDVMKAGVAIPLFWSAQLASKLHCTVLLAGQGADELFGGYHRYLTIYQKKGVEKVAESLFQDTVMSYETNFQRDEPLYAYHKVELRLPFVDTSVVRFALSLPVDLKIESADDCLRKRILRQLAEGLGIPAFIAKRPKKAIQFATGVDKALRDLAKSKGLTLREYVEEVFKRVHVQSGRDPS